MSRLFAALALFALLCQPHSLQAQAWPARPVKLVVPYPPGGATDFLARIVSQKLAEILKQPVIVENRGGGGSTIGTNFAAKSAPDGYTMLMVAPDLAINPALVAKLPYDSVKDFAPVTQLVWSPFALVVHPSVPANTLAELIALGKSSPARLTYASGGNGTGGHLGMESLKVAAGVDFTHVPYKGTAPAVTDLLGGQVTMMLAPLALVRGHVQSGGLRALATAGVARSPAMPDTPTVSEAGVPGFDATAWFGIVVPADTPAPVVARLNAELQQVMSLPEVREALTRPGMEPHATSSEEFGRWILSEMQKWEKVVKLSGAKVD